MPRGGHYSDVPTLVLSGELDSITTAAEGALVVDQFPNARQVTFANSFHVTAAGDYDHCAEKFVRAFIRNPDASFAPRLMQCAASVPPLRAMGTFPTSYRHVKAAVNAYGSHAGIPARKAVVASAATVADVIDRWYNNYTGFGYGLRGGQWSYTGNRVASYKFHAVRFTKDLAVSGRAVWSPYDHTMKVHLTIAVFNPNSTVTSGRVAGGWDTRAAGAEAHLHGQVGDTPLSVVFPAP